jgi:hypothetical protein
VFRLPCGGADGERRLVLQLGPSLALAPDAPQGVLHVETGEKIGGSKLAQCKLAVTVTGDKGTSNGVLKLGR